MKMYHPQTVVRQFIFLFMYVFCFRICSRTKTFPFFQLTFDRFRGGTIYSLPLFSHGQARFPDMATCTRTVWKGQLFCCEIGFFLDDIKKKIKACVYRLRLSFPVFSLLSLGSIQRSLCVAFWLHCQLTNSQPAV